MSKTKKAASCAAHKWKYVDSRKVYRRPGSCVSLRWKPEQDLDEFEVCYWVWEVCKKCEVKRALIFKQGDVLPYGIDPETGKL
jgi:hypothetical protein